MPFSLFDLPVFIQAIGLIGIGAIIFAESGLLVGFFLPGDSLLFTAGLLSAEGIFPFQILILISFIAAVAGDSVGYAFGYRIGPKLFRRNESRLFKPAHVDQAREFFERYGPKAVVLARFMPIVRTLTPILAGVGKMRYRTFVIYNLIGAAVWGIGIPTLGYALGRTVPNIDRYLLPIIGMIIAISFLPPIWVLWKEKRSSSRNNVDAVG